MKILLIGNTGNKHKLKDGQTTKMRLYHKKMIDEGVDVVVVDLESFFHRPFSILNDIKKQIKICDRIVLISGERACRFLIPLINRYNKQTKKPFVLPLVGSSVLHFSIDHLNQEDQIKFVVDKEYNLGKRIKKIERELHKITYILPETNLLKEAFDSFYNLDSCVVLNNFRDECNCLDKDFVPSKKMNIVFLSRVMGLKGIFELLEAINQINKKESKLCLDIYGDLSFNRKELNSFNKALNKNVQYKGGIANDKVITTLSRYDLFVFPTNAAYEGTPGVISESLIAGTPILSSNFPQAKYLLKDGYDSIFFRMSDLSDLICKLNWCINNRDVLLNMRINASNSGEKYLYQHERDKFLKYICGIKAAE